MKQKISIWDLDYYFAKDKTNCFNPDAMKISSYHKQMGDSVVFCTSEYDTTRPFDTMYIFKEKNDTPNPPSQFFINPKVLRWGEGVKYHIKWDMSPLMLAARPDYLLYPKDILRRSVLEKSDQLRLFDNQGKPLEIMQDIQNTFRGSKRVLITDKHIWTKTSEKDLVKALKSLQSIKKLAFFEPIRIQKIIFNKEIEKAFLELKFYPGVRIQWTELNIDYARRGLDFLIKLKERNPTVKIGALTLKYSNRGENHWLDKKIALEDFANLKSLLLAAKVNGIEVRVNMGENKLESPYFQLFEMISCWTYDNFQTSWLEWLTWKFSRKRFEDMQFYWCHPYEWHQVFRAMLRQTYEDINFIITQWKDKKISLTLIPYAQWVETFKIKM